MQQSILALVNPIENDESLILSNDYDQLLVR
jgi:hypothetical protein